MSRAEKPLPRFVPWLHLLSCPIPCPPSSTGTRGKGWDEGNSRIQGCLAAQKLHTRTETCPDCRGRKMRPLQCLGMGTHTWGCQRGVLRREALGGDSSPPTHPGCAMAALKGKHKNFSDGFEGLGPGCLEISSSATTEGHLPAPRPLGTQPWAEFGHIPQGEASSPGSTRLRGSH